MSFLDLIKQKNVSKGEDLESEALIVAQKVLCNMGLDLIPKSYSDFLHHYNGAKYNGAYLFGATVEDDMDIIDKNEQMEKPQDTILLGYNEFDLLCYEYKQKQYKIVDRNDFEVMDTYSDEQLDNALSAIFNI